MKVRKFKQYSLGSDRNPSLLDSKVCVLSSKLFLTIFLLRLPYSYLQRSFYSFMFCKSQIILCNNIWYKHRIPFVIIYVK